MQKIEEGIFEPVIVQRKKIQLTASGISLRVNSPTEERAKHKQVASLELRKVYRANLENKKRLRASSESGIMANASKQKINEKHFQQNLSLDGSVRRKFGEINHQDVLKGRFICNHCKKSFSCKSDLRKHEVFHNGQRQFACSECGKGFFTQVHLNRHQLIHTGEKPYSCDTCEKSFSQNVSLITHRRTHTGERPHLCLECGKSFTAYSNFSVHQMSHGTREKPYKCNDCGKQFARADALRKHRGAHHPNKE